MIKKFLSVFIVVVFMLTAVDTNVFAADEQAAIEESEQDINEQNISEQNISEQEAFLSAETWEGDVSGVVNVKYPDRHNVMRTISFTVKCAITKEWSEGNYGMITEAFFYTPANCTIDGDVFSIRKDGTAQPAGSSYVQRFIVNNSSSYPIEVEVSCDEWATVTFSGREVN